MPENLEMGTVSPSMRSKLADIDLSIRKLWIQVRKLKDRPGDGLSEIEWSNAIGVANGTLNSLMWGPRDHMTTVSFRVYTALHDA